MITSAATAPVVRRGVRAAALVSLPLLTLASAPAFAEAGDRWSNPDPVDTSHVLLWFVVAPVVLFVVVVLFSVLPALIRREPILPKHGQADAQWIGGPGKGTQELPAADDKASAGTGGASGNW